MYVEIDVMMIGEGGKEQPLTLNRDTVSYYRGYVPNVNSGKEKPIVMLYLKGSIKALKISSTYDAFKRKISSETIELDGLNEEQCKEVHKLINILKE